MSLKGNVDAQRESWAGNPTWANSEGWWEASWNRVTPGSHLPPTPRPCHPNSLHPVIEPGRALSIPHPASPLGPGRSPRSCQLLPLQKEMWKWWVQADNLAKVFQSREQRSFSSQPQWSEWGTGKQETPRCLAVETRKTLWRATWT